MSTQYIAALVSILLIVLPKLGITIGSEELTTTVAAIFGIGSQIVIMYKRTQLQKAPMGKGDVNGLGMRK